VIGIIQAFHALSSNNASGPEVVMASISEALVATAVGLMVAIPAVIAFNVLARGVKTKMANSETVARIVLSFQSRSNAN
jgi:biopolymer transport protein ExbB